MNKDKYKSVVVDIDTYRLIDALADEEDRTKSATLKRLVEGYCGYEAEEANLDSGLIKGGTPRLKRLLSDLRYYCDNSSNKLDKVWIVNDDEKKAMQVVIDALADTVE